MWDTIRQTSQKEVNPAVTLEAKTETCDAPAHPLENAASFLK